MLIDLIINFFHFHFQTDFSDKTYPAYYYSSGVNGKASKALELLAKTLALGIIEEEKSVTSNKKLPQNPKAPFHYLLGRVMKPPQSVLGAW